jgi:hypothetical protein
MLALFRERGQTVLTMQVKLQSQTETESAASCASVPVAPSAPEFHREARVAASFNKNMKRYFIMDQNGIGGMSAAFGPLELSAAKMHSSRLNAQGLKTCVFPEETAKDEDIHGVNALLIKYPNGYQD